MLARWVWSNDRARAIHGVYDLMKYIGHRAKTPGTLFRAGWPAEAASTTEVIQTKVLQTPTEVLQTHQTTLLQPQFLPTAYTRVMAIYQIMLGSKTYKYYYETDELPNPRPTQPKKK